MKVLYDRSMPKEVREVVAPLVKRYSNYFPQWLNTLHVQWDGDTADANAMMTTRYDYRECILHVCPHFLDCTERERDRTIRHEFMHAYTTPIKTIATEALRNLLGDDYPSTGSRVVECAIDRIHEAMTEDLAIFTERIDA